MRETEAQTAHRNGWTVGTLLIGDEGYGPTVIEITAIGIDNVLALAIAGTGSKSARENTWTFTCRDWQPITWTQVAERFEVGPHA